jgi:hypothetical protein
MLAYERDRICQAKRDVAAKKNKSCDKSFNSVLELNFVGEAEIQSNINC